MLSLKDKLRAVSGQVAVKQEQRQNFACMVCEKSYPLEAVPFPRCLSGEDLFLLTGQENRGCAREDILFLDTETTGLSHGAGTVAFLVGIGLFEEERFVVRQYLMRDYDEEESLLGQIAALMRVKSVLCTYNGASFDIPLLESRFVMNRMRSPAGGMLSLDLLHQARRLWKRRLQKCNLGEIENQILGIYRDDDLPGSQVPERYFLYLKTKDLSLLDDILRHNVQDIVSMVLTLDRMLRVQAEPGSLERTEDLYSLGRVFEKRNRLTAARQCYRAVQKGTVYAMAQLRLADTYRHGGEYEKAAEIYTVLICRKCGGITPYVEMAKYAEHRLHDPDAALEYTSKAIMYAADHEQIDIRPLEKRYARLLNKTGGNNHV